METFAEDHDQQFAPLILLQVIDKGWANVAGISEESSVGEKT